MCIYGGLSNLVDCVDCVDKDELEEVLDKEEKLPKEDDLNVHPDDGFHPFDQLDELQDRMSLLENDEHKNERCRTYSVSVKANHNGYKCPFEDNFKQCTQSGCGQPVDCVGSWDAYGTCNHDASDHKNRKCRTYKISVAAKDGGHGCPFTHEFEQCTKDGCAQPVDCVGSWDLFGTCYHDGKDHKNKRCRKYKVSLKSANNGYSCPHTHDYTSCTTQGCPQPLDCAGAWSPYGSCKHDSKDHKNRKCRTYLISTIASNNGYACPYAAGYSSCTTSGCSQPVDCLGEWNEYTECSYAGFVKLELPKLIEEDLGPLNGKNDLTVDPDDDLHPLDQFMIEDRRSLLENNFHKNERCRTYKVTRKSSFDGYECPYTDGYLSCTKVGCTQPVDCVGSWDEYGSCKYKADEHVNIKCQHYKITTNAAFNGFACPFVQGYEACTKGDCSQPEDCVGGWGNYGVCSHDSEAHTNKRCKYYKVTSKAAYNGKGCPYANEAESCTTSGCTQPVDCVGAWTAYVQCKHNSDHTNKRCKTYKVIQQATANGYGCPHSHDHVSCTKSGCAQPVDCVGDFGDYNECFYDIKDHKNKKCKHFKISAPATFNGYGCAYAENYEHCVSRGCEQPVDCIGQWGTWQQCEYDSQNHKNKKCRFYKVTRKSDHDGYGCPFTDNYKACIYSGCSQPKDCLGQWESYGECKHDKEKHANIRCKSYKIVAAAEHNGMGCPYATGHTSCTTSQCFQPVDCVGA